MSCTLLCCRCSDTGLDRQEGALSDASCAPDTSLCPPWVTAQAHGIGLQLGRPSPSLSPEHFLFCCKGSSPHPAQLQWGSWKYLKSMTPSQETWAGWTHRSCERHCWMWQHLGLHQLPSWRQLPGRHHSRAPQIRFAGVPWGWLITRGFFHHSCTVWK